MELLLESPLEPDLLEYHEVIYADAFAKYLVDGILSYLSLSYLYYLPQGNIGWFCCSLMVVSRNC